MTKLWQKKLVAWLHDPAEKCFVLFHDPSGHEGGTIKTLLAGLKDEIGLDSQEFEKDIKVADWYAASADRPQWPTDVGSGRYEPWAQVDFSNEPILIHPLTGHKLRLNDLSEVNYKEIKDISKKHFEHILKLGKDAKSKFLALWRFGSENTEGIGQLWSLLPADTRVPDHSIWNHLDLTSAFAGASSENSKVSLLSVAFGPVQSFIAQARSMSDLWAGSHLLSSIVWEGMKVIADEIGPDAFLFPQLRGLPIVDVWLLEKAEEANCRDEWWKEFEKIKAPWLKNKTDSNPLFAACLPNKFTAIVPESRANELANKIALAVRDKVKTWAKEALTYLDLSDVEFANQQLEQQLVDFPNVYWSVVHWPNNIKDNSEDLKTLKQTTEQFTEQSFFETDYYKTLKQEITIGGKKFMEPKTGVLYPAIYELSDKSLAVSKTLRNFQQLAQTGFRCTLCGEREWLANKKEQLSISPRKRKAANTAWKANIGKYGIKADEHLCAICTLKRLWPTIFVDMVKNYIGQENVVRYVISTHTMSLLPTLNKLGSLNGNSLKKTEKLCELRTKVLASDPVPVTLPKKFYRECGNQDLDFFKRIPSYLDDIRNEEGVEQFNAQLKQIVGQDFRPETYYALILMDGDSMGAWLSATELERRIKYSESWHPKISENLSMRQGDPNLENYRNALKTASPTRHAAISQALNVFSSLIVPHIIEDEHNGKLIYSGGDDVLAMAPTDDVLSIIQSLRMAYSGFGIAIPKDGKPNKYNKYSQNGFVLQNKKLLQVMGNKASASVGVVIVHHQTPLAYALRELRKAEQEAKSAGRNAFCIKILKRAGGEISFTDNWWSANSDSKKILEIGFDDSTSIGLFEKLVEEAANTDEMSRKAFYAIEDWLHLLPDFDIWSASDWQLTEDMATSMLTRQFKQHGVKKGELAKQVVAQLWTKAKGEKNERLNNPIKQLKDLLFCVEFFARETRSYKQKNKAQGGDEV